MKFFVTLVDGWRLQTNDTTEIFILHVAKILDTRTLVKQLLGSIKNTKTDFFFFFFYDMNDDSLVWTFDKPDYQ